MGVGLKQETQTFEEAGRVLRRSRPHLAGVLCNIPLDTGLPLTVDHCVADPLVGSFFLELLEDGEIDARLCFMLYLVIQRALRERSNWAPYPFRRVPL
jgi:hypothetical protein